MEALVLMYTYIYPKAPLWIVLLEALVEALVLMYTYMCIIDIHAYWYCGMKHLHTYLCCNIRERLVLHYNAHMWFQFSSCKHCCESLYRNRMCALYWNHDEYMKALLWIAIEPSYCALQCKHACALYQMTIHFSTFAAPHTATHSSIFTCSVLQCVAVCCSVLQCVAVCCSVLQSLHRILRRTVAYSLFAVNASSRKIKRDTVRCVAMSESTVVRLCAKAVLCVAGSATVRCSANSDSTMVRRNFPDSLSLLHLLN